MNKILLVGRLVRDPELKTFNEGEKVAAKFIIAVNRNYREANGERKADFIPVSIWGKRAEFICSNLKKGSLVTISGRLRTSSYEDNEGKKRYVYEVVGEDFKFSEVPKRLEEDLENTSEA